MYILKGYFILVRANKLLAYVFLHDELVLKLRSATNNICERMFKIQVTFVANSTT